MVRIKRTYSRPAAFLLITSFVTFVGLQQHLVRLHHVTTRTCQPLICLFTSFRPGVYKIPVTNTVAQTAASVELSLTSACLFVLFEYNIKRDYYVIKLCMLL